MKDANGTLLLILAVVVAGIMLIGRVQGFAADTAQAAATAVTPELRTRIVVLTAAKGTFRNWVYSAHTSGLTDRSVRYIAKRPAKNINSLDSHTMVPTATMLGRFAG